MDIAAYFSAHVNHVSNTISSSTGGDEKEMWATNPQTDETNLEHLVNLGVTDLWITNPLFTGTENLLYQKFNKFSFIVRGDVNRRNLDFAHALNNPLFSHFHFDGCSNKERTETIVELINSQMHVANKHHKTLSVYVNCRQIPGLTSDSDPILAYRETFLILKEYGGVVVLPAFPLVEEGNPRLKIQSYLGINFKHLTSAVAACRDIYRVNVRIAIAGVAHSGKMYLLMSSFYFLI